jgi:uncharacterized protein YbaR (Trm112 family)
MEIPSPLFVRVLRCPLTGLSLQFIPRDALPGLGLPAEACGNWSGALLRADARAVFPVRGGIPVLLAEELRTVGPAPGAVSNGV